MAHSKLPLRQYLETIKEDCHPLEKEQLTEIILGLAKEVQPNGRKGFLKKLATLLPDAGLEKRDSPENAADKILYEIKFLRKEVLVRIDAIEDGSYWDDPDDEDLQDEYYMDNDPDMLSENQMSALVDFFGEADHLFLQGDKTAAEKIYRALLTLISEVEEFGVLPDSEIELYEIRARFARCVYEGSSEKDRVEAMLTAMNASQATEEFAAYLSLEYPLLQDVIDAETGDLDGFDTFLTAWKSALGRYSFTERRISDLLLEATYLDEGVAAIGGLARIWGAKQPAGYLFWLEKLAGDENWQDLRNGALEALDILPLGGNRRSVSNYLIKAGEKLGEDKNILTGYRERFRSKPGEGNLLDLLEEATRQRLREEELEGAIEICSEQKKNFYGNSLFIKALLMAGRFDQAFRECKEAKEVGWSNSATGLLFAGSLYLLTGGDKRCTLNDQQLRDYSDNPIYFDTYDFKPRASTTSCYNEIVCGLNLTDKSTLDLDQLRKWTGTLGESRINHIVSNKHRRAYDRAATVLGSLAELMAVSGDKKKAQNLLHEYCKVLYNRHVAFRREVKAAVGRSKILRELRVEV